MTLGRPERDDVGGDEVARCVLPSLLWLASACVPSNPPVDDGGTGAFPDMSRLDRSQDCQLNNVPDCGYPEGPYGYSPGEVIPNLVVHDCDGHGVELAEYLAERPDTGSFNRGVIVAFGAGWCLPCRTEAELLAEIAEDARQKDVDVLQILVEHFYANQSATKETCEVWRDDVADSAFTVLFDPDHDIVEFIVTGGAESLPLLLAIDANGHIRFEEAGEPVERDILLAQIDNLFADPYGG